MTKRQGTTRAEGMHSKAKWTLTGRVPGHLHHLSWDSWHNSIVGDVRGLQDPGLKEWPRYTYRAGRESRFAIDFPATGDVMILRECAWAGSTPTPNLVP